jgi:hypothetical protein
MLTRRELFASAIAPAALAVLPLPRESGRMPIVEMRHADGDTAGYLTPDEADDFTPGPDLSLHPAEFIPTGRWLVFLVKTSCADVRDPLAVPDDFDSWLATAAIAPGGEMTRAEAVAAMIDHNRRRAGQGRRAVAVELGEPQGLTNHYLDIADGPLWMVTTASHRPVRAIGR